MKKGMMLIPVIMLVVLFLTLVMYGSLYLLKKKNEVLSKEVVFEDISYDAFIVEGVLLDEGCSKHTFIYSLLRGNDSAVYCIRNILDSYNEGIDTGIIGTFIIRSESETLFYYSYGGSYKKMSSHTYPIVVETTRGLERIVVEVTYGKR